jgi:sulfite reductase alpha subunit-like flavoprotein
MPAGVKQAIREAAQKYGDKTEEAKDIITTMEKEGRLIEECWN